MPVLLGHGHPGDRGLLGGAARADDRLQHHRQVGGRLLLEHARPLRQRLRVTVPSGEVMLSTVEGGTRTPPLAMVWNTPASWIAVIDRP